MARIGLRREHIKTVIVTEDREFKHKAVAFLNGSAFAAEKICVPHMQKALDTLQSDSDVLNFILDATSMRIEELNEHILSYTRHPSVAEVRLLVYVKEEQTNEKALIQKLIPTAHANSLPMAQAQFNKVFHNSRNIALQGKEPEAKSSTPAPSKAAGPSDKDKAALSLIEASAHLKDTVDLLNAVAKDKKRVDAVRDIGQKFNGLIGAFSFFTQGVGYPKMRELATVVDDIARTYNEDQDLVITEKHWTLLVDSARTLYLILKDMRENKPVQELHVKKADALLAQYAESSDISRRQSQSQDEVDQLLDAELFRNMG